MTATPVSQVHPKLFHYTSEKGLFAILESQCLWATHSQFLNDTQEMRHFSEILPKLIQPELIRRANELASTHEEAKRYLEENGGPENVCAEEASRLAESMCTTLLNPDPNEFLFEFYVASFCTPDGAYDEVRNHGLLSQWRYYGQNGGYALVFDTVQLEQLIGQEHAKWGDRLSLGEVGYSSEPFGVLVNRIENIPDLLDAFKSCHFKSPEECAPLLEPLMSCCIHYKHWAFSEEREVRLVDVLNSPRMQQEHLKSGTPLLERERHIFKREDGTEVPHIRLFEGLTHERPCLLPIERIIVGPGPTQSEREKKLRDFLDTAGYNIEVTCSNMPIRF